MRAATRMLVGASVVCALIAPPPAETAWHQPVGGASPINQSPTGIARDPSLTAIGGVPYVAWTEYHGSGTFEIWVSRLNAAGTAWERVGGTSPINNSNIATFYPAKPSLTAIGGVPYVAWHESDATNDEIRVSRLNAAGTAWEPVVAGASPINQSPTQDAIHPSLTSIGGVPYVAWTEDNEIRVARLNAAGTAWEQVVGGVSPIGNGFRPSLTGIGGVPYVAWVAGGIRVSRLNAAGTAWEQPVGGSDPIAHKPTFGGSFPSLTGIGGIPYVAWNEFDATSTSQVRVSRLSGDETDWQEVVGGNSPINQSPAQNAQQASLTAIGGVPYVAWGEADGENFEIRVSRLNGSGTAWEQPVGGASPINESPAEAAVEPSLIAIDGVPYVAWDEGDGTNQEIRVSRLEPEFTNTTALPTDTGADLRTEVNTYGLAYPVGFDYGPGFTSATTTTATSGNPATITKHVTGLTPSTSYPFRPFATVGATGPRVLGAGSSFTTSGLNGPGATGPTGPAGPGGQTGETGATGQPGATGPQGLPGRDALVTCKVTKKGTRVKVKCTVVFTQNARAVRLTLLQAGRVVDRARARQSGATRTLEPSDPGRGKYTLRILTLDHAGGRSVTRQPVRVG